MGPTDRELFLAQLATLMEDEAEGATPQASVAAGSLCGVAHLWAQVHSPMQAPNVNAAFFKPDLGAYSQLGGGRNLIWSRRISFRSQPQPGTWGFEALAWFGGCSLLIHISACASH